MRTENSRDAAEDRTVPDRKAAQHIEGLDGLRGFAAWIVVVAHLHDWRFQELAHKQIGTYGVFLFFVLSGFLMGHLYLTKALTRHRLNRYIASRFARVVPFYYLVVIGGYLFGKYVDPNFAYAMSDAGLIRHFLFFGSTAVFWSIGPEIQFYVAFLLLWWVVSLPPEKASSAGVVIGALCLLVVFFRDSWPGILVLSKLHIFMGGIALAILRPRFASILSPRAATIAQIIALLFLAALFLPHEVTGLALYPDTAGDPKLNKYYQDFGKLLPMIFVVGAFSLQTRFADFVFGNRFAALSGKCSFSIYLLHMPVLYALERMGVVDALPGLPAVGVAFAAVSIVGLLSYFLVENPIRVMFRRQLTKLFDSFSRNGAAASTASQQGTAG